ncbi:TPA: hypothetical protein ACWWDF_002777 [Enterococcus faecium]
MSLLVYVLSIFMVVVFLRGSSTFAEEQQHNILRVSAETEVRQNEEFLTTLEVSNESDSPILVINHVNEYDIDLKKTQESNTDTIQSIQKIEDGIELQLQNISSQQMKNILIYGSFTSTGEKKQAFFFKDEEQLGQKISWMVSPKTKDENTGESTTNSKSSEEKSYTNESKSELSSIDDGLIPIEPFVSKPDNFDWTKLDNDGIDLSGFTEQTTNTPVKLSGGAFDTAQRTYFMFFGHVGKGNTYNNDTETFAKVGSVNAELGEYKNIMSPVMIGAKKTTGTVQLFGYDYDSTIEGASSNRFDIGRLDESGTKIIESSSVWDSPIPRGEYIEKLYTKDNEVVAYGFKIVDSLDSTQTRCIHFSGEGGEKKIETQITICIYRTVSISC